MKNRFLNIFMITVLTVSMLVGCGENETGINTGADSGTNTEANVDSDANKKGDTSTQIEYGVSNPDATYNETEYCYIVSDASFVKEKYNDGTEFDRTNWTPVNTMIKLNAPISIYNPFKDIMGYMKTEVMVVYVSVDGEWSYLGFAGEVAKDGLYPNGGTYVRTDELKAVMEEIVIEEEETESKDMSDKAKAYFDKIREAAEQVNDERVAIKEEYPEADVPNIEEVDSKEGLECLGNFSHRLDDSLGESEIMLVFLRTEVYDKYYIEYLDETETSVEFNFYCTMQ